LSDDLPAIYESGENGLVKNEPSFLFDQDSIESALSHSRGGGKRWTLEEHVDAYEKMLRDLDNMKPGERLKVLAAYEKLQDRLMAVNSMRGSMTRRTTITQTHGGDGQTSVTSTEDVFQVLQQGLSVKPSSQTKIGEYHAEEEKAAQSHRRTRPDEGQDWSDGGS
jgi:TusA-related sulfurtransferase